MRRLITSRLILHLPDVRKYLAYPTLCPIFLANGTSTTVLNMFIQLSSGALGLISILSSIYVQTLHIRNAQVYNCSFKNSPIPVITIMPISGRVLNLISIYP